MNIYPPTYNLRELADRIAQEARTPVIDVTKALAAAILERKLRIETHFPEQLVDPKSPVPGLTTTALMHLREIVKSLARPDMRPDDLVRISVGREAFRDWAERDGLALPQFWFGTAPSTRATAGEESARTPRPKLKRQERRQKTLERNEAIRQRAAELIADDRSLATNLSSLARKLEVEMSTKGSPLSAYGAIDSETIRKICAKLELGGRPVGLGWAPRGP